MSLIAIIIILVLIFGVGGGGYYGGYGPRYYGGGLFLILLILLLLFAFGAHAATTEISAGPIYKNIVEPYALTAFGVLFSGFLGWGLTILQQHTNIRISDSAKASVQQAALNAAGRILASQEGNIANVKVDVHSELIAKEVPKIIAAIPGDLKRAGLSQDDVSARLRNMIAGKVGQLQAAGTAVPTQAT